MNFYFRNIGSYMLVVFLLPLFLSCSASPKNENNKPNVVIILADDMGYGDAGCYNPETKIATPNINRLADEGILFTDAHASGAWCVPSRYGLVTGKYPRAMSLNTRKSLIEPQQETIGSLMKRNGYRTAVVGKWHLGFDGADFHNPGSISEMPGGPVERGFDYFFGMHASLDIPPYFYIENNLAVQPPTGFIPDHSSSNATSAVSGAFFRAGAVSPDFKHDEVLDKFLEKADGFITDHTENYNDEPFLLYFPMTAPHTPWLPKKKFIGKSDAGEYGDFMMQVDDVVGKLIAQLERAGVLENTIIIFSSDNGPVWFPEDVTQYDHKSVGPLRGMKSDMWEGGSRMPFLVSYPAQFKKGKRSDHMIAFTDVLATLADIVDDHSFAEKKFDSHSFLPVLMNPGYKEPVRTDLVIEKKVYRKGNWKYIHGSGQGGIELRYAPHAGKIKKKDIPGELYNLRKDPSERNNLYDQYPEKVKEMENELQRVINGEI